MAISLVFPFIFVLRDPTERSFLLVSSCVTGGVFLLCVSWDECLWRDLLEISSLAFNGVEDSILKLAFLHLVLLLDLRQVLDPLVISLTFYGFKKFFQ